MTHWFDEEDYQLQLDEWRDAQGDWTPVEDDPTSVDVFIDQTGRDPIDVEPF